MVAKMSLRKLKFILAVDSVLRIISSYMVNVLRHEQYLYLLVITSILYIATLLFEIVLLPSLSATAAVRYNFVSIVFLHYSYDRTNDYSAIALIRNFYTQYSTYVISLRNYA